MCVLTSLMFNALKIKVFRFLIKETIDLNRNQNFQKNRKPKKMEVESYRGLLTNFSARTEHNFNFHW